MGLFDKMREPVFLRESHSAEKQLEKLRELKPQLNEEGQRLIQQDIKCLEYGIAGEQALMYELKNSYMPMYILHDVNFEDGGLTAQIDYMIFTRKMCFVVECKNLFGNIEINSGGDFIRTMEFGGKWKKEGIYSPITQKQRHLDLLKERVVGSSKNFLQKFIRERSFDDMYRSVIVLANPKTVLNARYAPKKVKQKVVRCDQLIQYIKDQYQASGMEPSNDDQLRDWAQSFLDIHKETEKDYTEKYEQYRDVLQNTAGNVEEKKLPEDKIEDTAIFQELRAYRLKKSREEQVKPYFLYNDNQLKDLIGKMPRTREELIAVSGFGRVKADKYGEDILKIIAKY